MSTGYKDIIRNNHSRAMEVNKNVGYNDITRLASVDHRSTTYRRNGMLNFGAKQMLSIAGELDFYLPGVGGPPIVS